MYAGIALGRLVGHRFTPPTLSVLTATLCVVVLATHVHVGFNRVRIYGSIPSQSARDRSRVVPLPELTRLADAPAAIVLRVWGGAEPTRLTVAFDDRAIAQITVPPAREIRVDTSAYVSGGFEHRLIITGDRFDWRVSQVEIANIYGFSTRPLSFVIVPREGTRGRRVPLWLLPLAAIGLLALPRRRGWPDSVVGRTAHRVGAGLVFFLFAATLVLDIATPYKIVLSWETFLLCTAVIYLDPLARGYAPIQRSLPVALHRWGHFLPHAVVCGLLVWSVGQAYRPGAGFTALIVFGAQFDEQSVPALRNVRHVVTPGSGYDGQFYAQLALDPGLRDASTVQALDNPGYRGRRILFPWIASALGLARPGAVIEAYALLNVLAWFILGWLLLRWLPPGDLRSTMAWSACMLSQGLLMSVHRALPDGPSVLLLALGVLALEQDRSWVAAGILGLSGLGKETNLIGGSILVPQRSPARGELIGIAGRGVVLIAPLLLWLVYLWRLGLGTGQTGLGAYGPPLVSYVEKWTETVGELRAGWVGNARINLLTLVALTTQAAVLLRRRQWLSPWWRVGATYAGLMLVVGPGVWIGSPTAASRVVLPMTVAFNLLIPRGGWFWPLLILGNADALVGLNGIDLPWLQP